MKNEEKIEVPVLDPKDAPADPKKGFFHRLGQTAFIQWWVRLWKKFKTKYPGLTQFFVFFMLSNGVTVLQMILMPILKGIFEKTNLIGINFQIWSLGQNIDGSPYFIFDFPSGTISSGGGGGFRSAGSGGCRGCLE